MPRGVAGGDEEGEPLESRSASPSLSSTSEDDFLDESIDVGWMLRGSSLDVSRFRGSAGGASEAGGAGGAGEVKGDRGTSGGAGGVNGVAYGKTRSGVVDGGVVGRRGGAIDILLASSSEEDEDEGGSGEESLDYDGEGGEGGRGSSPTRRLRAMYRRVYGPNKAE